MVLMPITVLKMMTCLVLMPERKVTVEDVKYVLSAHYQGTPFDCYSKVDHP